MILLFRRKVLKTQEVFAKVFGIIDGQTSEVGYVHFPNKNSWTKFIAALQKGALSIRELEVRMENDSTPDEELLGPEPTGPTDPEMAEVEKP